MQGLPLSIASLSVISFRFLQKSRIILFLPTTPVDIYADLVSTTQNVVHQAMLQLFYWNLIPF